MNKAIKAFKDEMEKTKNRLSELRNQFDEIKAMPDTQAKHDKSVECSVLIEFEQCALNNLEGFEKRLKKLGLSMEGKTGGSDMKLELRCVSTGTITRGNQVFRRHSIPLKLENGKIIEMQVGDTMETTEKGWAKISANNELHDSKFSIEKWCDEK